MAQQSAAAPVQGAAPGPGPGAAPNAGDAVDRLADILGRLVAAPSAAARREDYKTLQFSGEENIEYFIQQFEGVAQANQWDGEATFMHLREALTDGARDCGQSFKTVGIYASLRARYWLFLREARSLLNNLRKDSRTPLAEHASEVERLEQSAYPDLPDGTKREMTLEQFVSTLDNTYLQ